MKTPLQPFEGRCHCGRIELSFRTAQQPHEWSVRACQCSFCRAHAALTTSDPSATIEFRERHPGAMNRYRFGQRTADFLTCRDCGVYVGAVMTTLRGCFGIINVNALHPMPAALSRAAAMDYGAEAAEQRIARREQRWSPVIEATAGASSPRRT